MKTLFAARKFAAPVIAALVAAGFGSTGRADSMLYRFPLDGDISCTGSGAQTVTTSGSADPYWSSTVKFGSKSFKSVNAMAYVLDNIETTKETGWTLSFWFNSNSMASWKDVLAFAIGDKMGKFEKNGSDQLAIYRASTDENNAINPGIVLSYTASAWNHIALVSTTTGFDVYLNGSNVKSVAVSSDSGLSKIYIGCNGFYDARTSSACIDELAIFDFPLSAAQIGILKQTTADKVLGADAEVAMGSDMTWAQVLSAANLTAEQAVTNKIRLVATGSPTLTFETQDNSVLGLDIAGDITIAGQADWYSDGCFGVTLLSGAISTTGTVASKIKDGFKGKVYAGATGLSLYAQNQEVISINVAGGPSSASSSPTANLVSGTDYYGIYPVPGNSWNNITGCWSSQKTVTLSSANAYDGETTTVRNSIQLSGSAKNTWQCDAIANPFLRGYLDDGNGVDVTVTGVPYDTFDVIVYVTSDNADKKLRPISINGQYYSYDSDGTLIEVDGDSADHQWGQGAYATPEIGKNALCVTNIANTASSVLTIHGCSSTGQGTDPRGTVCAVQIINRGGAVTATDYAATAMASAALSTLSWSPGALKSGGLNTATVTIGPEVTDEVTLTVDTDYGFELSKLAIVCAAGQEVRLVNAEGKALAVTTIDLTSARGTVTLGFDPGTGAGISIGDATVLAMDEPVTGTIVGNGTRRYNYSYTGTVAAGAQYRGAGNALTGATVGGSTVIAGSGTLAGEFGVQNGGTMTVSGTYTHAENVRLGGITGTLEIAEGADVTVSQLRCCLGNGARTTVDVAGSLTVDTASDNGNDDRGSYRGILFNEFPSTTFALNVTGALTATNIVLTTARDGTSGDIVVDGGTLALKGIRFVKAGNTLTLRNGGTLALTSGLYSQNYCTYTVDGGAIKYIGTGDTLEWTPNTTTVGAGGLTVDVNGKTVAFAGTLAGTGPITLTNSTQAAGTVNLRTARPEGVLAIGDNVTVKVTLANEAEVPVLKVASAPAEGAFVLRDPSGNVIEGSTVTYDAEAGTVTLVSAKPTWTRTGESASFEDAANWNTSPAENGEAIIRLSGTTAIDVGSVHAYSKLTIGGEGRVTFTGAGSLTATETAVLGGADVVFPAGYAYGALTVAEGAKATSEGGATIASTAGGGTFAITNGTVTIMNGSAHEQARVLGALHTVIENGGVLDIRGRDTFTCNATSGASLTIEKGGKFTTMTFVRVPKVHLDGGTIETTGGWNDTWSAVCYDQGVVVGGGTTSCLTNACVGTAAEVLRADHQLQTSTAFEVKEGATLVAFTGFRNGPDGNGLIKCSLVKTGAGEMSVRGNASYTGTTTVSAGRYSFDGSHATTSADQDYTVASGAALTGSGSITGTAAVVLAAQESVLGGGLTVENLTFASGARVGNAWNAADVTLTGVVTNGNLNTSGQAWLNVANGSLTLAPTATLSPDLRINVATDGCLVAGAGDVAVTLPHGAQAAGAGSRLASEVKVDNGVKTTGAFRCSGDFDLANWIVTLKTPEGVRPPVKTAVMTLTSGAFSGFRRDAVPAGTKSARLSVEDTDEGSTLYYNANQYFYINVR